MKRLLSIRGLLLRQPAIMRPKVSKALKKIMPRVAYTLLTERCPDPRRFSSDAALMLNQPEEVVLKELSWAMRVPFVTRVRPVNLKLFRDGLTIHTLRAVGAIPLVENNLAAGLICCAPELLETLPAFENDTPIFLATWTSISAALEASEKALLEDNERRRAGAAKAMKDLAVEALRLGLAEAQGHGSSVIDIAVHNGQIEYSFSSREKKTARGVFHPQIRPALETLSESVSGSCIPLSDCTASRLVLETEIPGLLLRVRIEHSSEAPAEQESQPPTVELTPRAALDSSRAIGPVADPGGVLVIDDNPAFTHVLSRFLERSSIQVTTFTDSVAALAAIRNGSTRPVLAVLDLHMPRLNGIELLAELRGTAGCENCSAIILTSDDQFNSQLAAIEGGADAYLPKSIDPRLLTAYVQRFLERTKVLKAA